MEAPEVKRDLERAAELSAAFQARIQGRSSRGSQAVRSGGASLAEAIASFEAIEELMGKLAASPASSMPATRPTRPAPKFYGDVQEQLDRPSRRSSCSSSWS